MFKRAHIWKLQRPIRTNEEFPTILAYTEGKVQMAQIPLSPEIIDELFGNELKIYAKATVHNGVLKVKRIVGEQDW